jgi:DNA-binding MarR family transcriptional regulator
MLRQANIIWHMAPRPIRPRPLNADEEAVVRALGRAILVLPRLLDAELVSEQRLALSEYTTLIHLSEAPNRQLRMSELAADSALSLSGMTRIVGRLEAQGLVERVKCADDGRGSNAVLTDAGLVRLRKAWPTHLASVRRHIVDHIEDLDLATLARALSQLATQADRKDGSGVRLGTGGPR